MQEQRLELEWDVLVEENLQNTPIRKEIYCIDKSAIKNNSIVGILQKVNNLETHTNINSNELLQSQLTGEQKKKCAETKFLMMSCEKKKLESLAILHILLQVAKSKVSNFIQGPTCEYSDIRLLWMWHGEKIGSFLIFCCKNTTCVVLFMQSTYIISEVLRIGICPDDAFTLDYRMHQSAGYSWSCSYTILKWQLVTSSVCREIWSLILDILLQKYNLCGFIHA